LDKLLVEFGSELGALPQYDQLQLRRLGWGMPYKDLQVLYLMLRSSKPARYIEMGSGVSTYIATLAANQNREEGYPCEISCIEPYSSDDLRQLSGINLVVREVQEINPEYFDELEARDIFFIDSSHIVKLDSDVPYLHLEVLPRLKPGVLIHVHDTPFPYNTPFPADFWLFSDTVPPMFWNEAMLTQALLSFNDSFKLIFSAPLMRNEDGPLLANKMPHYQSVKQQPNTFNSLWIQRVK